MVVLNGVSKTFREGRAVRHVLRDLTLEVGRGEFLAVRGPSGSGKSTLLNLIAGLDQPDSGTIAVAGRRIDAMGEHQRTLFRRRQIGYVFQFFSLLPTLTVAENISLSLELTGAEDPHRVQALLRQIGLADRGDSYPDRLSGGEQQRVAIARAIAHRPPLVLADEPTGNLDAQTEASVLALLTELHREQRMTLIVATHSDRVAGYAGRAMRLGKLESML